ncbi:hypothetical protein C0971_07280 [Bacillus methanolicus]|uniref:hypothetical protein n=1 Tax=Bacillus methanolicus TaxID=1471 RepID=UPI00200BE77A|nr:hypothetical protein [Bacillus methanolicus]UQD51864.1 hypothetical protein C0971_07280 [Bacillus methanolicus]
MAIQTLLNYNRSANNIANSASTPFVGTPLLLAEFGLFVPQATNFVELIATVGWSSVPSALEPNQSEVEFFINQDNIRVVSTREEAPTDGSDPPLFVTTTFQGVLTNVSTGHHVYQLFAQNLQDTQSSTTIVGPVTISGKVIGPES